LWIFKQAGQFSGISKFASIEANTIISVVSPVGTALPMIGQRIMILGMGLRASADPKKSRYAKAQGDPNQDAAN
jgi:hypothetical protein